MSVCGQIFCSKSPPSSNYLPIFNFASGVTFLFVGGGYKPSNFEQEKEEFNIYMSQHSKEVNIKQIDFQSIF